ncbi:hypothetical protein HY251_20075, partial [bacterium]|nr:hypothetical protein [bacterium]
MLKLRLGLVLGTVALLAGCPEPVEDFRRGHNETKARSVEAEYAEGEYACPNLRLWREELDLPAYLSDTTHDKDDERTLGPGDILTSRRERLKKEYVRDHQGVYVVCRTKLEVTEKATAETSGRG